MFINTELNEEYQKYWYKVEKLVAYYFKYFERKKTLIISFSSDRKSSQISVRKLSNSRRTFSFSWTSNLIDIYRGCTKKFGNFYLLYFVTYLFYGSDWFYRTFFEINFNLLFLCYISFYIVYCVRVTN